MAVIRDVLNKFKTLNSVDMVAVVTTEGLQIESINKSNLDIDSVCAIATTSLQMSQALGYEMERGESRRTVLEYAKGAIVLEPLTPETMILVVCTDPCSIGQIRYLSHKYRQDLINALNEA